MTVWGLALAFVTMAAGTLVGGTVGFGTNLVAAPILALINPELVPVPIILASGVFNLLVARRDRGIHPWHEIRWPLVGLVPASIVGAATVAVIDQRELSIMFAVLVLLAVALSVSGLHPPPSRHALAVAGMCSGFMGTTAGIGGPPIALMFQHHHGQQIRASLSRFFGISSVVAIIPLAAFGQVHIADLARAAVLIPGGLFGFVLSQHAARRIDHGVARRAVLLVSGASACVVLLRALT